MDLVVDANIVIAALISPTGHTADLFFSLLLSVFAPELLLAEVEEHKKELLQKTGLSAKDFKQLVAFLSRDIRFFPTIELLPFLPKAKEVSPDPDDVAYFALALKLRCPLWSNDKLLQSQAAVKVISTAELLKLLS
ncbi:MAG: PIN domain-containing protein [Nanoarchaeota archaeon]|nr:PIN domain-containing protein [Nanoarchaeota archaeon]